MKRRLKVTLTKIQRQTVTMRTTNFLRARCPVCDCEVEMLTAADVIGFLEIENQTLENLIAVGKLHVTETVSGGLRFCKDSLFSI